MRDPIVMCSKYVTIYNLGSNGDVTMVNLHGDMFDFLMFNLYK